MKAKPLIVGVAALALTLGIATVTPGFFASAQPYGGYGPMGMMGGYGMGPGMMFGGGAANQPVYRGWGGDTLDYKQVAATYLDDHQDGSVDRSSNTITYSGKDITINMVAVEPGNRDQTFEVSHLTNPTLVVPRGAAIHLNLVNMDRGNNMEHAVILTPAPPPYPFMAMMKTGHGLAWIMPLLPWRSDESVENSLYAALGATFTAEQTGTYWYVCPTPGHASQGMFGKFVVQ